MKQLLLMAFLIFNQFCIVPLAAAQELDTAGLKKSVDILSGVLREGLGLNESTGLFGISESRVDSVYLQGQGVVMEIQTPLATRRNRVNINALAASIYRSPNRSNPFAFVARSENPGSDMPTALSMQQSSGNSLYQSLLEEIQSVDFSAVIESSIRQASSSARSLRELGELDQNDFNNLQRELFSMRDELGSMKEDMMRRVEELRELYADSEEESAARADQMALNIKQYIENFKLAAENTKTDASRRAAYLHEQYELAKSAYEAQWRADVEQLEADMYVLLCDYGATLRDLPEDEFLTIVFSDLGEVSEVDVRSDRVHVLSKTDLSRCQSGRIDASELQQRSSNYNY